MVAGYLISGKCLMRYPGCVASFRLVSITHCLHTTCATSIERNTRPATALGRGEMRSKDGGITPLMAKSVCMCIGCLIAYTLGTFRQS